MIIFSVKFLKIYMNTCILYSFFIFQTINLFCSAYFKWLLFIRIFVSDTSSNHHILWLVHSLDRILQIHSVEVLIMRLWFDGQIQIKVTAFPPLVVIHPWTRCLMNSTLCQDPIPNMRIIPLNRSGLNPTETGRPQQSKNQRT